MALASRLKRLEAVMAANSKPGRKTLLEYLADLMADCNTVAAWLEEHGYANALEVVAAGEAGPALRTESWPLARHAKLARDALEEKIYAGFDPDVSLWHSLEQGWCAPINGRLEYLGEEYQSAVARFRQLTGRR